MEEDKESQRDELLALTSIFEDEDTFVPQEDELGGSFYASVQLPIDCTMKLDGQMAQQARALGAKLVEDGENPHLLSVFSLPPIELNFQYPPDYPSKNPPTYSLSCKWLSVKQLNKLCQKLDETWDNSVGEVVIFVWTEVLREETLDCLDVASPLVLDTTDLPRTMRQRSQLEANAAAAVAAAAPGPAPGPGGDNGSSSGEASGGTGPESADAVTQPRMRAVQDIASLMHLMPAIVVHDREARQRAFDMSHHTCGVCFDVKFGRECLRFSGCDHVFCKACMGEHFSMKIREADLKGLVCPGNQCDTQALPMQVKELVEPELYRKYDEGLLELSLGEMADIVYCPRIQCQSPAVKEENNMALCPGCRLAFCVLCKTTYHGVAPCKVTKEEYQKIMDNYESATDDERAILEQRYGKHTLRQVIENCNSEAWIKKHSKMCPNCGRAIQKYDGCNKMTCPKCRCYFCWLCSSALSKSDPYGHYRGSGPCSNRLFVGLANDNSDTDDSDDDEDVVDVVNIENWWQFV